MNAKQNARLAMYNITVSLDTEGKPEIIAKMPQFSDHLAGLREIITRINDVSARQDHFTAIASLDKEAVRSDLENPLYDIAAAVRALATKEKEFDLADEWHLPPFALRNTRDSKLLTKARNLITLAASRQTDLLPYDITEKEILAFTAATDLFESVMQTPRKNRINKSGATKELVSAFAEAAEIIRLMDILVDTQRNRQPLFYADYRSRRTIINPPSRKTAVLGIVRNSAGEPLSNARITIDGQANAIRSSKKGRFRIASLPEGVYILRANLPGHHELPFSLNVTHGISSRPEIELRES